MDIDDLGIIKSFFVHGEHHVVWHKTTVPKCILCIIQGLAFSASRCISYWAIITLDATSREKVFPDSTFAARLDVMLLSGVDSCFSFREKQGSGNASA